MMLLPTPEAFSSLMGNVKVEVDAKAIRVPPRNFDMEIYVDDNCTVCPTALALASETERALSPRLAVTVYNMSHMQVNTKVNATPAFCLRVREGNGCVYWEGIPVDPADWEKFITEKLEKAYIATHPYVPKLIERIQNFAKSNNYVVVLDTQMRNKLLRELLENYDIYGQPYCPCRPQHTEATICPCVFAKADIAKMGHCLCGLFWSREYAQKWLENSKRRNAKKLETIDKLIAMLTELKDRIILNDRDAVEKTMDAVLAAYSELTST
jgi:ferredoxin-thioredoxin reductase catalytic subunit